MSRREPWEETFYRSIIDDMRSTKPLAPEVRHLLANELEDKWFPPIDLKSRERLQERANVAMAYLYLIEAHQKALSNSVDAAKELVAASFNIEVENLEQRIKRGKRAAIQLGMSIQARQKRERDNALKLNLEYARDVFQPAKKGQI